jgi:Carbohydrate binding domain/G8 domain
MNVNKRRKIMAGGCGCCGGRRINARRYREMGVSFHIIIATTILFSCSLVVPEHAAHAAPVTVIGSSNVVEVLMGDHLDVFADDQQTQQQQRWAVYDCTRDLTTVYDSSATSAPTTSPTLEVTPEPTLPPTPEPTSSLSILPNWNFEENETLEPWTSNGGATVSREFDEQRNSFVGTVRDRTVAFWQGIGIDVTTLFQVGEDYNFQMSARLLDAPSGTTAQFSLTLVIEDDNGVRYVGAIYTPDGLTSDWTVFEGYFGPLEVTGTLDSIFLYAEGPAVGLDFAIDDVLVTPDLTTSSPTEAPTPKPVQPDFLVSSDDNTEFVTIPQPPPADFTPNTSRTNCPHVDDDGGGGSLIDFHSYFPSLSSGQDITIPAGMSIVISRSVEVTLGLVTIPPTSTLILGENEEGVELNVHGMVVDGSLVAGSESCRLQTPVTITLHGDRPSSAQDPEYKGISVKGEAKSNHLSGKVKFLIFPCKDISHHQNFVCSLHRPLIAPWKEVL